MPENIEAWWSRRQRSKGVEVPYPVGSYREAWAPYAVLKRQYHPDLNRGITLTQIPPAADVYLTWQCEVGHYFIATPAEQRSRPGGGARRRSVWCTLCTLLANPPRIVPAKPPVAEQAPAPMNRPGGPATTQRAAPQTPPPRRRHAATGLPSSHASPGPGTAAQRAPSTGSRRAPLSRGVAPASRGGPPSPPRVQSPTPSPSASVPGSIEWLESSGAVIDEAPVVRAPGQAFWSARAPKPASAAEAELRQRLGRRVDLDLGLNAVAVRQPFFGRLEVWPDFVLAELAVAVEFDTPGRFGLEHLGSRLDVDRRKDRLLRAVGWEVVRIRCGSLPLLGEYDLEAAGVSGRLVDRLLDRLREVRGPFLVDAYLREPGSERTPGEGA